MEIKNMKFDLKMEKKKAKKSNIMKMEQLKLKHNLLTGKKKVKKQGIKIMKIFYMKLKN